MNRLQHWIDKIEDVQRQLATYNTRGAIRQLEELRADMELESRTAYVVQRIDRDVQAQGEAIKALLAIQHARMTPEEWAAQARRDNDYLFGDREVGR